MTLLEQFKGREAGPLVQFIKYGIAGGAATGVCIGTFYLMSIFVLDALSEDDTVIKILRHVVEIDITPLADGVRARNAAINNGVAFVVSNMVCYLINIAWVFKPGRHHWLVEIGLFYLVSGVSFALGTGLQTWLIAQFGVETTLAFGCNLVTALLINYGMRKFVIFKG
ncbi:MAG: GtrA family protein [Verrucomicrobia bacterium]|nr:GtrA family protein [Verrucomicrobiota bacterium]